MLSSSSPVTAMTRSARWIPARSSTQSSVASPYCAACSISSSTIRKRRWSLSISVTSRSLAISSRARFHPTFPAPAMITYICRLLRSGCEDDLSGFVDGVLGGTDRQQALPGVPGGARGVGDADNHLGYVESALGDLRDHQVGVVSAGGGHEHVGVLDPRRDQPVEFERGADREAAAGVLPARRLILVEALVRQRIAVEHRDLVPFLKRSLGDGRSHPSCADDEDEHCGDSKWS